MKWRRTDLNWRDTGAFPTPASLTLLACRDVCGHVAEQLSVHLPCYDDCEYTERMPWSEEHRATGIADIKHSRCLHLT